jgi:hypothetical protein
LHNSEAPTQPLSRTANNERERPEPTMSTKRNKGCRVLAVGAGSPNADMVAEVLRSNGIQAKWTDQVKFPSLRKIRDCDVVYGIYLQTCSRYILAAKLLGRKTIIHFVGSDAYWVSREISSWRKNYWRFVLSHCDLLFYVSPHLEGMIGRKGIVLPFPIATEAFKQSRFLQVEPDRDILYYCPSGEANERIYRLSWIQEYARAHPTEKITIIGNVSHPADYAIPLANVIVIPYVERSQMPTLYRHHRKLVRMTTEDGLPRMVHEALLSGLEVIFNGQEMREVPREREPAEFAATFRKALDSLGS